MKKLFLALLAAATVTSASAQANSWLLYGDISFGNTSTGSAKSSQFGIQPGVGYQLNNNWTVGLNLAYNMSNTDDGAGTTTKTSDWGVGPFARYTHTMGSMFYCFGQADVMYRSYSTESTVTATSFGINLWPAVGMNVGKGYALNFSLGGLGYNSMSPKGGGESTNTLTFNFGQTMMIGLSKNFTCMKHKKHDAGDERKMDNDGDDAPKKGKKAKKDKDDE